MAGSRDMGRATAVVSAADVSSWDREADVVVVGFGAAGACTAIEAREAGAERNLVRVPGWHCRHAAVGTFDENFADTDLNEFHRSTREHEDVAHAPAFDESLPPPASLP